MASNEELRAKFAELQEELNKSIEENIPRFSRPQIQRVPKFMGERAQFGSFYLPKLISIGPIHCMEYYKKPGTDCKFMWLAMYLMENHETPFNLFGKIFEHYEELSAYFSENFRAPPHQILLRQHRSSPFVFLVHHHYHQPIRCSI